MDTWSCSICGYDANTSSFCQGCSHTRDGSEEDVDERDVDDDEEEEELSDDDGLISQDEGDGLIAEDEDE